MDLDLTTRLPSEQSTRIAHLARSAGDHDGVAPLSEQTLLSLTSPGDAVHLVATDGDEIVGYGIVEQPGVAGTGAEIVVAPPARRAGIGRALLREALGRAPGVRVWAHGDLPAAAALARSEDLVRVRELLKLHRPLASDDEFPTELPAGFTARTFTADDIPAWLAVNAAAFASHPEQGRMTAADVEARMTEPWFDAQGFFLVHDEREKGSGGTDGAEPLAAFHWTKTVDDEGEVYVVGVHPRYQGLRLGRAVTALGLAHLRDRGLPTVTLYVDGDNAAAVTTYERQGFTRLAIDVMYARDDQGDH